MKIEEKLRILRDYYLFTRNVGHTSLMKDGTKNYTKEKFVLGYKKECFGELECKPSDVISWHNLDALKGHIKPLAIDNSVMSTLLDEVLNEITSLQQDSYKLKLIEKIIK